MLKYERLSSVPDLVKHVWKAGELDSMQLTRELEINGDETLLNETIVGHCQDTLGAGRNDLPWWEILIIRNSGKGPSSCVIRVHHVIGDGKQMQGLLYFI